MDTGQDQRCPPGSTSPQLHSCWSCQSESPPPLPPPPYKTENLPRAPQTTTTGFGKHHVTWQVSEVGQPNRPLNPHSLGCEERRVVPAFSHKQGKHFPIPSQSETESKPAPRFQANFLLEL